MIIILIQKQAVQLIDVKLLEIVKLFLPLPFMVMQMMEVEGGFTIPAGGSHALMRGGDHVMLMGLKGPMTDGEAVTITLTFEKAGDIELEVPIDLKRKPKHKMKHGN